MSEQNYRYVPVTDERREWGMRGPILCPEGAEEYGCPGAALPISACDCQPHHEDDPDACGEDEAAGCHFCAHRDVYMPCPRAVLGDDAVYEDDDDIDLDPCNYCPHDNSRHRGDGCLDCGCVAAQ